MQLFSSLCIRCPVTLICKIEYYPMKKERNAGHRTFGQDRFVLSQSADIFSSNHIASSPSLQVPTPREKETVALFIYTTSFVV